MKMVVYSGGGYRLWDPLKEKIVSSRDVTFNESKSLNYIKCGHQKCYLQEKRQLKQNGFSRQKNGLNKSRLVTKGLQEDPANNVYAPVARLPTICLLISIAVSRKWEIRQLDVPAAFLNGYMDDDIYIKNS
ncbi:hypothetical protein PR048_012611 [Dryococelus australis]|uniref:Reverse transcriptase Ty1/copia-type domain-containing protein n=1 Tax=Dryococelus australis TaxID=614101 RepID=A0ABQ9HQ47_9NEOP|nr:hypothetical protein PR048_012611 [Dryococelus australis]